VAGRTSCFGDEPREMLKIIEAELIEILSVSVTYHTENKGEL
jgi:hypothetical protein